MESNIPKIEVTFADSDGENAATSIVDEHTDVEDLQGGDEVQGLKAALPAEDGAVTENESFDVADEDDEEGAGERALTPPPLLILDYGGTVVEVSRVHEGRKEVAKFKSELKEYGVSLEMEKESGGVTDVENIEGWETEYEADPEDYDWDEFDSGLVSISEMLKTAIPPLEYRRRREDDSRPLSPVPLSDAEVEEIRRIEPLTDVEALSGTSGEDDDSSRDNTLKVVRKAKGKRRRRNRRRAREQLSSHSPVSQLMDAMRSAGLEVSDSAAVTDVEDLSSDESFGSGWQPKTFTGLVPKVVPKIVVQRSAGLEGTVQRERTYSEGLSADVDDELQDLTEAEDLLTDVEEEKAVAAKGGSTLPGVALTDVEDMSDFEESDTTERDIRLPKPSRKLILVSESASGHSTSIILPLDDFVKKGLQEEDVGVTDVEELGAIASHVTSAANTPDLPEMDFGNIEERETQKEVAKKKAKNAEELSEPVTDSEEIFVKRRKRKSKKAVSRPLGKLLSPSNIATVYVTSTDVEDLASTENEEDVRKKETVDGATDVEDVDASSSSSEEASSRGDNLPPGTQITFEESNADANTTKRIFYAPIRPEKDSVVPTESEEVPVSTDEEADGRDDDDLPATVKESTESIVHVRTTEKTDWDHPLEQINMKNYSETLEHHTDVEDLSADEAKIARDAEGDVRFEGIARGNSRSGGSTLRVRYRKIRGGSTSAGKEWTEKGQAEIFDRETQGIRSAKTEGFDLKKQEDTAAEKVTLLPQTDESLSKVEVEEVAPPKETASYVTSPTLKRRSHSARVAGPGRPVITPYRGEDDESCSPDEGGDERYIVQEPEEDEAGVRQVIPPETEKGRGELPEGKGRPSEEAASREASVAEVKGATAAEEVYAVEPSITSEEDVKEEARPAAETEAAHAHLPETKALFRGLDEVAADADGLQREGSVEEAEPEETSQNDSTSSKPRVIFYLESEEEVQSDLDSDIQNALDSPGSTEVFLEGTKEDLKKRLQTEQSILEDRLMGMRSGVFDDLSDESLLRTKELVDERLRKISETKSIDETMIKREKSPAQTEIVEQFKIGRFHVTTSLDSTLDDEAERKIAEKLKTERRAEELREEVEKELPEKLSDEGLAEVVKEIKKEAERASMQLPLDERAREEKKERTLKRVERRFERMASETLESEKREENVSEEKLDEKREVEFQKMLSQLSTEEVAECQQEYLQLWEEGGLSSLTPTDDWESRDMDTPENELDEDSPKKSESSRGLHGSGKCEEPVKSSPETQKSTKLPVDAPASTDFQTSPLEPVRMSSDIPPVAQSLDATHPLQVGSSPSEARGSPGEPEGDHLSYEDRKKFWEEMTTSQSSESGSEMRRSFHEGRKVFEGESGKAEGDRLRSPEDGGLVRSLTELYSEKIAAGEIVMPAIPRPASGNLRDVIESETGGEAAVPAAYLKREGSDGIAEVSELEAKLRQIRVDAPATEGSREVTTIREDAAKDVTREASVDSEKEFLSKYGEESLAFDNSAFTEEEEEFDAASGEPRLSEEKFRKRPPPIPLRKTIYERSMSLPAADVDESALGQVKAKKRYFEEQMKKEMFVEQLMTQVEEECTTEVEATAEVSALEPAEPEATPQTSTAAEIHEAAVKIVDDLLETSAMLVGESSFVVRTFEKSEPEEERGEKREQAPATADTLSGRKPMETASLGESEDTQSESDVTPEDARGVDNGEAPWDGSGTQSGGTSPKDDFDMVREPGIGRWIGQEDLSQQIWEKEDVDASCYKIDSKWERTRSESVSPKEQFVCTPEEHYPDTVWEVPVQEQLESEEIAQDIPIEKQVIIEKDEEEEEEEEEEEVEEEEEEEEEVEEEEEMEEDLRVEEGETAKEGKLIKITEVEAREIAEEVLDYIEFEVENRASILITDIDDIQEGPPNQVTEYLRQLAGEKNLDDEEINLIQSVLAQKHREKTEKLRDREAIGSSLEITDEDLRSNDPETDTSPLDSRTDKSEEKPAAEKSPPSEESAETVSKRMRDVEIVDRTIAEVKESLEAAQEELLEERKKKQKEEILKKESPSEFEFKGIDIEKKVDAKHESEDRKSAKGYETIEEEVERPAEAEEPAAVSEGLREEMKDSQERPTIAEEVEGGKKEESSSESEARAADARAAGYEQSLRVSESTSSEFRSASSRPVGEITSGQRGVDGHRHSASEDSPRSMSQEEGTKSQSGGEEALSSSPSLRGESGVKPEIKMRRSAASLLPKGDRRSGTDLEPYSSSGESYYHSCEQTSSRPCSSDVEALIAGVGGTGSSEYESALSQELSSRVTTASTSAEYHTAVSSLSSRESIKSLDSESSGHLASIEISSEASETLIPSALELDKDFETSGAMLLDDDSPDMVEEKQQEKGPPGAGHVSAARKSLDDDFEVISESEVAVSWAAEVSEDECAEVTADGTSRPQKMKRSHEMTFQPEPRPIFVAGSAETPPGYDKYAFGSSVDESLVSNQDERLGSSLEETASLLSMSLSTASEMSAIRTVIEHPDKLEGSLTMSATSADSGSREELDNLPLTQEMSTSTIISSLERKTASVTITTSTANDQGMTSVSTQVTSVSRKSSMVDEAKSDSESSSSKAPKPSEYLTQANGPTQVEYVPEYDEIESTKAPKKVSGHRRKESTSSFVPTMRWTVSEGRATTHEMRDDEGFEDGDKYAGMLTEKEVKNDEKKEVDDSEKSEDVEGDVDFAAESHFGRMSEEDGEFREMDGSRPQSQISKTDSEGGRRPQSADQPDSELSELMKQGSSETEREDPIERPMSPEPEDFENKDDTPEFSSEAQASITELEMEYSGACSRRDEYASHVSPIREEKSGMRYPEVATERYEHEKGAEDEGLHARAPAQEGPTEAAMGEKHESETREKETPKKMRDDSSPGEIPDITVTEHMTPLADRAFYYPDVEEKEEKERKATQSTTPDTSASSRASSSTSTDQGREYVLEDAYNERAIKEDSDLEDRQAEFSMSQTDRTVLENVIQEEDEASDSPNSDSFEMLDKPDITDEFVIIEEVGREADVNSQEGRSINIVGKKRRVARTTEEDLIVSPPPPATKMTDLKYFPGDEDAGPFHFESDSPPTAAARQTSEPMRKRGSKEEESDGEFDPQIEENKKWMEMQFQVEQAAKIIGAYPYEMEFERGPLEDIKEEELGEFDSSSKIGSMGSQKESIGSFGSVKDSFSSTPDYDVLAGRRYFTRSGDHDDVSMSSLQEFELIEKKILLENGKKSGSSSSQDSLSSKKLGTSSKSGQGDDVSIASLREFENLENACVTVVKMERKAREEEAILSEIDEGHESQISESESCETVSGVIREKQESDSEDFDKRIFEIDEIIKQAQSNVERFADLRMLDKTESVGRGDSLEEVAKVPDLELDAPLHAKSPYEQRPQTHGDRVGYSTQVVTKKKIQQWRESEERSKQEQLEATLRPKPHPAAEEAKSDVSEGSDLLEPKSKFKSVSSDSLETRTSEKFDSMSMDSFDMHMKTKTESVGEGSDIGDRKIGDLAEDEGKYYERGRESSSSGRDGDCSLSAREGPPRADFMLGSTDSLDPSSSTATHATYHYETDSVMSSSFTSGGSNTMVSSTDTLDLMPGAGLEDLAAGKTGVWFENLNLPGSTEPFVTEVVEPLDDPTYSHVIHRRTDAVPEARRVAFRGPDAEKSLQGYLSSLPPQEQVTETREEDEHGNIHIRKVVKRRVILRPGEEVPETGVSIETLRTGRTEPIATETIEPIEEKGFSHMIHRKVEMIPDVKKVVFRGKDADKALAEYVEGFAPGEDVAETEEVDEHGNVHVKRVVQRRLVLTQEEAATMSPEQLGTYLKGLEEQAFGGRPEFFAQGGDQFPDESHDPQISCRQPLTQPLTQAQDLRLTGKEDDDEDVSTKQDARSAEKDEQYSATQKDAGMPRRAPLISDISVDDEAEYDPTEHDWRHQLEILNAEADEGEINEQLERALQTSSYTTQKKQ